ncbi:MAG: hypothetical protein WCK82_13620 [Bacteroidota bacterium]
MNYNNLKKKSFFGNTILIVFLFFLCSFSSFKDDSTSDAIIGNWENPDGGRKMEIVKKNNLYFGRILSVTDKNVKVKPGDIVLKNLMYTKGTWIGQLKIPAIDYDFDVKVTMPTNNQLKIVASYGLLSKTRIWKRI